MRTIIPSLVWFSALAGTLSVPKTAEANILTTSCASLPTKDVGGAGGAAVYVNRDYGFSFSLPQGWKGFRVLACKWNGVDAADHDRETTGPLLVIRHPLYTDEEPREDIPIMIFTKKQWDKDGSNLIVSAAPVPPTELGRNRKFVFALPPRFSYDELEGVQEVLDIVMGRPLRAVRILPGPEPLNPR